MPEKQWEKIEASVNELVQLTSPVSEALVVINQAGFILAFNGAATRVFDYEAHEVIGKNVNALMPEPYHSAHDSYLQNYVKSRDPKIIGFGREVLAQRKNGEVFPIELAVNDVVVQGELVFVGTIRDLTNREKIRQKISKYVESLVQSNQELNDFAHIASHDLKEPLRGLSNNALFLKEDYGNQLPEDAVKRLNRLIFLCNHMEKLINDLLYFSKLGKQDLSFKPTELGLLVQDLVSTLEAVSSKENIKVHISNNLPSIVCDEVRVREVFRNLIANAIKYNNNIEKFVEVGYNETGEFFVKDNGIGIPQQFYEDIFLIFKRLNDENDAVKGTGVGLTFVKKIIERHGGYIRVESDVGKGTTFYFTLPQNGTNHK